MRHQRHSHSRFPVYHKGHKGLLALAAVVLALCLLYSCAGGPVYSPRGRLVFVPLARVL